MGSGSSSKLSSMVTRAPARLAASILYDITRVMPAPAIAASIAASESLTVNLDRIGTAISRPSPANFQLRGAATLSTVMQS